MSITSDTSLEEIAALVSEALSTANIDGVLGGGGAVTLYSQNEYMSSDLDFITSEQNRKIAPVVEKLGFVPRGRDYAHPNSKYFIEFPAGPLAFGDRYIDSNEATTLQTQYGAVRIITPTQCVMDRIAWYAHGNDRQSRDQAILVATQQHIDWEQVFDWAEDDGIDSNLVSEIQEEARR
ncbi:MAG: hypothetical protein JJ957_20375 [Pseudomonadales bacterium]|nr:hypothetical protein [Pseudomonadales bacterium]MBO6566824.1 hypothetical protein [Pseudomonadales bacterium]